MSGRRLIILLGLALAVGGGAFWLSSQRPLRRDADAGGAVLPGLAAALDSVASVRLVGAGERTLVTLTRSDDRWLVAETGYPAAAAQVRRLLVALGELRVVEGKTSDPTHYAALGVEDVGGGNAQSIRVELGGLKAPVALLVGHGAGPQGSFVRVTARPQALEARPAIALPRAPEQWLARTVIDVAGERVQSVEVTRGDGPSWHAQRAARDTAHFVVPDLPKGRELSHLAAADGAAEVLAKLDFDDLRRGNAPAGGARHDRAVVRSFDGLVITLAGWAEGEQRWITIATGFDPAAGARFPAVAGRPTPSSASVQGEAERVARLSRGWQYRVPVHRYEAIFRKRDDVVRH